MLYDIRGAVVVWAYDLRKLVGIVNVFLVNLYSIF